MSELVRKAAGLLIVDRRVLAVRTRNTDVFVPPGGKLEAGEDAAAALARELLEELSITIHARDLTGFGSFVAEAAGRPGQVLHMDVFRVHSWSGVLGAGAEIEELRWLGSAPDRALRLGSVLAREILPRLTRDGLIG